MKQPLRLHTRLRYQGETCTVTAIHGTTLTLTPRRGHPILVSAGLLLAAEDFAVLDEHDQPVQETPRLPQLVEANLPKDVLRAAEELEAHLNEVRTGYRSGQPDQPRPGEPRPKYDPDLTTFTQRKRSKALELGVTVRKIEKDLASYTALGLQGLIDKRQVRSSRRRVDPGLLNALDQVFRGIENGSNLSLLAISRRVRQLVLASAPGLALPSRPTLNRLIREHGAALGVFLDAKTRRGLATRPPTPFRRFVSAFLGEVVILDSTRLDAFAWDESTNQWVQVQLTLAMEVYSRSIVAWRFTPVSDRGVDAALILREIIYPKPMRRGWPPNAQWNYPGIPASLVVQAFAEAEGQFEQEKLAAIPFVTPASVVVDHGKIYLSRTFRDACVRLGISVQLARPKTPTDKAPLERTFRTIRERFVEALPGYKGPSVAKRGLNVEQQSFYMLDELEELFAEWVATYW